MKHNASDTDIACWDMENTKIWGQGGTGLRRGETSKFTEVK